MAAQQKPSVSRAEASLPHKHHIHKNKGGLEHRWCDPAALEAALYGRASFHLLLLVISNCSTSRELYCAGDSSVLEDCTRQFRKHIIQTLGSLHSRTSVSAGHVSSSFMNPNSVTYRVSTTSRLPRLLQHYLSRLTQTASKKNNHHLFWAATSYSHPEFVRRKLRHSDTKQHQERTTPTS